ncbi:hypothetical protein ID850_19570 [Xenorhabdus sp. Flor]|uniref:hypothetical protein n=1 Tax=Xenorhabdus cabanillasii TaxID=351673 RepID=UPI0019C4B9D3|nr:hypothetical protein [Xenorhabdus sp. Flor]MBD2816866.1 hypothetical protein [Xenorhabdus sp. Flor]
MTNIEIIEIIDNQVKFSSLLGNGSAIWKGELPQIGHSYGIEFDIDNVFEWDVDITCAKHKTASINTVDSNVIFNAKIISYENDGILTVSLGGDIIFLEISENPNVDGYVSFSVPVNNISIYPVEL